MRYAPRQTGFTIPELVVVIVIVLVAIATSLVFVHPHNYDRSNRNAERLLHLAQISQALTKYRTEHGSLPGGIIETENGIGNAEATSLDLCAVLVPAYLKDLPIDPTVGAKISLDTCLSTKEKPSVYDTGYTIQQQKDSTVILAAPGAEDENIRISRRY